jgi:hypothetical protein
LRCFDCPSLYVRDGHDLDHTGLEIHEVVGHRDAVVDEVAADAFEVGVNLDFVGMVVFVLRLVGEPETDNRKSGFNYWRWEISADQGSDVLFPLEKKG